MAKTTVTSTPSSKEAFMMNAIVDNNVVLVSMPASLVGKMKLQWPTTPKYRVVVEYDPFVPTDECPLGEAGWWLSINSDMLHLFVTKPTSKQIRKMVKGYIQGNKS